MKDMEFDDDFFDENGPNISMDKENMPPDSYYEDLIQLNKNSKSITKLKNKSKGLQQNIIGKSLQKLKMKNQINFNNGLQGASNINNLHRNCGSIYRYEGVNKKIDFSNE